MRPGLPRSLRSSASVYYTERKQKNENGGGLGTRLVHVHVCSTSNIWGLMGNSYVLMKQTSILGAQSCVPSPLHISLSYTGCDSIDCIALGIIYIYGDREIWLCMTYGYLWNSTGMFQRHLNMENIKDEKFFSWFAQYKESKICRTEISLTQVYTYLGSCGGVLHFKLGWNPVEQDVEIAAHHGYSLLPIVSLH